MGLLLDPQGQWLELSSGFRVRVKPAPVRDVLELVTAVRRVGDAGNDPDKLDPQKVGEAIDRAIQTLTRVVVDWEGVSRPGGERVPYKPEYLETLPFPALMEIATAVVQSAFPGEADEKN